MTLSLPLASEWKPPQHRESSYRSGTKSLAHHSGIRQLRCKDISQFFFQTATKNPGFEHVAHKKTGLAPGPKLKNINGWIAHDACDRLHDPLGRFPASRSSQLMAIGL